MIGVDRADLPGVDIVADLEYGLPFVPDHCVDEIHSKSFFEHVHNFEFLMREIVRVLKPQGTAHVFVPHFSNPYYYSDPTHMRFFGLYTFYYFVDPKHQLRRKVPVFYSDTRIEITSLRLVFRSPFRIGNRVKKAIGSFFNLNPTLQELYEAYFCFVFPCYGIDVVFRAAS
jgi:ubiquinone/menaquinone biosynthesis C-methylase UbiE